MTFRQSLRRQVFVDTAAFVAMFDRRDGNHGRARLISERLAEQHSLLYTTNFVLAETHALLLKRLGIAIALNLLRALRTGSTTVIRVDEETEDRALDILTRYTDKGFSYTDATSFAVMERLGIGAAFTFDHHFGQYGFQALSADPVDRADRP